MYPEKMEYDKRFIFEVLRHQIECRLNLDPPHYNEYEEAAKLFWDSVTVNGIMHINRVKVPDIRAETPMDLNGSSDKEHTWYFWPVIYAEIFMVHHLFNDDYSKENVDFIDSIRTTKQRTWSLEGTYCYENIKIDEGDVVIDGGALIGDFSALAAQMGGRVYAFEPVIRTYHNDLLNKMSVLNNFTVVKKALGNSTGMALLDSSKPPAMAEISNQGTPCEMITIDDFAEQNNLHIDFIKSDVEGYERFLLKGAARVLKEDCPKLAIRSYHINHGNDAIELPKLIKELNPKYELIERPKTIFAYIP